MRLPNFLIVGAAKAGTTSLHHYLKQHPDVFMPAQVKETFFFSGITRESFRGPGNNYCSSAVSRLEDYLRLFANAQAEKAVGEASVAYLYFYNTAIPRIVDTLGKDVKIIISLRHPADRAFSNYMHHVRDGLESLSVSEAIKAEAWRKKSGWWWGFEYVAIGCYADQVEAYLKTFGREQVLILLYEDWTNSPLSAMRTIFRFLCVDETYLVNTSVKYNMTGIPRNRLLHRLSKRGHPIRKMFKYFVPPLVRQRLVSQLESRIASNLVKGVFPSDVRGELISRYQDDIVRLQSLVGKDLSHWLKAGPIVTSM